MRREVYAASAEAQWPAVYDDLLSDFVFREAMPSRAEAVTPPRAGAVGMPSGDVPVTAVLEQENLFWESIADSEDAADFEAYLSQFPSGVYAPLARNRAAALRRTAEDAERQAAQRRAEALRRAPGAVFRDCPSCPELVVIPTGRFGMGCVSGRDCESVVHRPGLPPHPGARPGPGLVGNARRGVDHPSAGSPRRVRSRGRPPLGRTRAGRVIRRTERPADRPIPNLTQL